MQEMFEASVDGEAYDEEKFSSISTAGMSARTGDPNTSSANGTATSRTDDTPAPARSRNCTQADCSRPKQKHPIEPTETEGKAEDILAMIRARQSPQLIQVLQAIRKRSHCLHV